LGQYLLQRDNGEENWRGSEIMISFFQQSL